MDAVEFLKEKNRMCDYQGGSKFDDLIWQCGRCGLAAQNNRYNLNCADFINEYPEEAVHIIEEWSNKHPLQTNEEKFIEVFGFAPKTVKVSGVETSHKGMLDLWWNAPYKGL